VFHSSTAKTNAASNPIIVTGNKAFLALYKPKYKSTIGKTDISIKVFILFLLC
jgi:hypothetical protein